MTGRLGVERWGVAAALILGAAAAATRIRAYDFFWHLAAGRWIWEHGRVPRSDPFSFASAGIAWVDHGWLYQIALYGLWSVAGLLGTWLGKVALGAGLGAVIWGYLRRQGVGPGASILVCLAGLAGASTRFTDRPEMVTLLFVALAASWLCSPGRWPWALIPLTVVWANVHAGSILAPLMALAALAGVGLDRLRGVQGGPHPGALTGAAAGAGVALLMNPYGLEAVLVPFRLTRLVGESWVRNPEWTRTTPAVAPGLFVAVVGLAVAAWVRRDRVRGVPLMLAVLGAALALQFVRNIGVFFVLFPFLAAAFFAGPRVEHWLRGWRGPVLGTVGLAGFLLAPAVGTVGPGLEPGRYPVEAVEFLQREGLSARRFNEVAFGGYLIWSFPDQQVFIDGRNEVYPEILPELFDAFEEPARFWALTRTLGLDVAVLRYPPEGQQVLYPGPPPRMVTRSWSEVYFPSRTWALVHWDDTAMVRIRRETARPDWLVRHELVLNPDDWSWVRERIRTGEIDGRRAAAELAARAGGPRPSRRAQNLARELASMAGEGVTD